MTTDDASDQARHASAQARADNAANAISVKYKMAFDAASGRLPQQDGTLGNLRNRATGLFTIAALIASFSSTIGLISSSHPLPTWGAVSTLAVMIAIGVCAMYVLWPTYRIWSFGLEPISVLDAGGGDEKILEEATRALVAASAENEKLIRRRAQIYSLGAVLLIVEAALVVAAALAS